MTRPFLVRAVPSRRLRIMSTIRERAFFEDRKSYPVSMGDRELAEELSKACPAYRGAPDETAAREEAR